MSSAVAELGTRAGARETLGMEHDLESQGSTRNTILGLRATYLQGDDGAGGSDRRDDEAKDARSVMKADVPWRLVGSCATRWCLSA